MSIPNIGNRPSTVTLETEDREEILPLSSSPLSTATALVPLGGRVSLMEQEQKSADDDVWFSPGNSRINPSQICGTPTVISEKVDGLFRRYFIPDLSIGEYLSFVSDISRHYDGIGAGISLFDTELGCYAQISLIKCRAQSESDYERIKKEFKLVKSHPLNTDQTRTFTSHLFEFLKKDKYNQTMDALRANQQRGILAIVNRLRSLGVFNRVFSPTDEYRFQVLRDLPETIACSHLILLSYKELTPHPDRNKCIVDSDVLHVVTSERCRKGQIYARQLREQSRPWYESVFGSSESPLSQANPAGLESVEDIEDEVEPPEPAPPIEPAGNQPSGGLFFRVWAGVCSFFAAIYNFFRNLIG